MATLDRDRAGVFKLTRHLPSLPPDGAFTLVTPPEVQIVEPDQPGRFSIFTLSCSRAQCAGLTIAVSAATLLRVLRTAPPDAKGRPWDWTPKDEDDVSALADFRRAQSGEALDEAALRLHQEAREKRGRAERPR